ncbi:accessory Sec system protein translocase subunit SecY2 [Streptococcus pluranimalium]
MLNKYNSYVGRSLLGRKIMWTLGTIFLYMIGRYLPIATIPLNQSLTSQSAMSDLINNLALVTGGQFSNLTLFSLGLSPWMTSMIIWRFLTLFKWVKVRTKRQEHFYQMWLMLAVALIQAFGISALGNYYYLPDLGPNSQGLLRLASMVILVAGAYVLMWIGQLNAQKGLGSSTVIIITNIIISFLLNTGSYFQDVTLFSGMWWISILLMMVASSFLVLVTVIVYRAEYRIPLKRIMLTHTYSEESYIPIRLTPAGGLPFMYAMTLMSLPPIVFRGLLQIFPENGSLRFLADNSSLTELSGILIYIALLFFLAIGFAYFNLDPTEVAKQLQKSGDYIEHVRPGEATRIYIARYLKYLAIIGAFYTALVGGLPLLLVWKQSGEVGLALIVNNIYIVTTLLLGLVEQVDIIRSWKRYGNLL